MNMGGLKMFNYQYIPLFLVGLVILVMFYLLYRDLIKGEFKRNDKETE